MTKPKALTEKRGSPTRRRLNTKSTKRTLKFLASTADPELVARILSNPSKPLAKSICNAVFNAANNDEVALDPRLKRLCKRNSGLISELLDKHRPIDYKRQLIGSIYKPRRAQKGGAFPLLAIAAGLLPTLISTVLSKIGSGFVTER